MYIDKILSKNFNADGQLNTLKKHFIENSPLSSAKTNLLSTKLKAF